MEKYNDVLVMLRVLFPHATDVRIEVDTNESDIRHFSNWVKEISKTSFYIETGIPEPMFITGFRNPFGYYKINKSKEDGNNNES